MIRLKRETEVDVEVKEGRERGKVQHTSFRLTSTGASAAVIASPFAIVGGSSFDSDDFAVCLCGSGFRDTASIAIACESSDGQESRKEELETGNHSEEGRNRR